MATQIVEKLLKLVLFYKIILLSFSIILSGALIIIFVSPDEDFISILKYEVIKEVGIAYIIIGLAILFYEYFLSPTIEFILKEKGVFDAYLSHFNDLWDKSVRYYP